MDGERHPMRDGHLDLLRIDAVRAGEGTEEERAHAATCPECRRTLDAFRTVEEELRAVAGRPVDVPAGIDRAILEEYRRAFEHRAGVLALLRRRWYLPAAGVAAAAGLALLLLPHERAAVAPRVATLQREPAGIAAPPPAAPPGSDAIRKAEERIPRMARTAPEGDVSPAGAVDILAAYRLALEAERRKGVRMAWNRDEAATEEEKAVDAVARKAVTL